MDPVTAFTVAGTVLQFLDTACHFAKLAYRLYKPGPGDVIGYSDLRKITESLRVVLPTLEKAASGGENGTEKGLGQLARDCSKTANQLLEKVKIPDPGRKRDALKHAFCLIWKENEIKSLQERLTSFRSQLNFHLLVSIRKSSSEKSVPREHVSQSAEQQTESLRQLQIVQSETAKIGGIAASILQHIVSQQPSLQESVVEDGVKSLQNDLVRTIFEAGATDTTCDPELEGFQPCSIQLYPSEAEQARSRFLASLRYDEIYDRETRIVIAHESTLQWVFRDDEAATDQHSRGAERSTLPEWLESDNGRPLYWITGKPGSGKSTLMKFLCCPTSTAGSERYRSRCQPYLETWAGRQRHTLVVASFYFWNSGADMQVTQAGLFRTLLAQIAEQRPEILPSIAPREWEALCLFGSSPRHWSEDDLRTRLFLAIKVLLETGTKICLFIDGLDEFAGCHESLIRLVRGLIADAGSRSNNVKVCVASRPWNVFQHAFGLEPSLRLEDLTYNDIKNFVVSKFAADIEFEKLRQRYRSSENNPAFADALIDNIVDKASGVFLWVDLVVASLLAGMTYGDRIEDFQRRLDELPPELENLYDKILHSLDERYLGHAAQYFALVEASSRPLRILELSFADEESPESAIKMEPGSLSVADAEIRAEAAIRRLNSRCKGFLEVERARHASYERCWWRTVQYLHRTVRDFIKSDKAQHILQSAINARFDPSLQLCLAHFMDMKKYCCHHGPAPTSDKFYVVSADWVTKFTLASDCLRQASRASSASDEAVVALLDDLKNRVTDSFCQNYQHVDARIHDMRRFPRLNQAPVWAWPPDVDDTVDGSFLALACFYGVVPYVKAKTERGGVVGRRHRNQAFTRPIRWPLLLDALFPAVPNLGMIECLLDIGASPNFAPAPSKKWTTPWYFALQRVEFLEDTARSEEKTLTEETLQKTLRLLYQRGGAKKPPKSHLTPAMRRILEELKKESKPPNTSWRALAPGRWFTKGIS